MANLTNYAEKKLLDHTLAKASYTMPSAVYLALFTASPGETGSLTAEVSGGSYARVELTSKMAATVLGTGILTNSAVVTFAVASAAWGSITHVGVCDASSSGNVLMYMPLASAVYIGASYPALEFVPGALNIFTNIASPDGLTQYAAKKWMDHLFGVASFTMPTNVYLAMLSADPTSAGTLTNEIATGGYGRQIITSLMDAAVLETGIAMNNDTIVFPNPTANYSVSHYGVMDAVSSGNMLLRKARGTTLSVISGGSAVSISSQKLALKAA